MRTLYHVTIASLPAFTPHTTTYEVRDDGRIVVSLMAFMPGHDPQLVAENGVYGSSSIATQASQQFDVLLGEVGAIGKQMELWTFDKRLAETHAQHASRFMGDLYAKGQQDARAKTADAFKALLESMDINILTD